MNNSNSSLEVSHFDSLEVTEQDDTTLDPYVDFDENQGDRQASKSNVRYHASFESIPSQLLS